jgi:ribosomal protein L21
MLTLGRKNSRKKNGHRQTYIKVEIKEIVEG